MFTRSSTLRFLENLRHSTISKHLVEKCKIVNDSSKSCCRLTSSSSVRFYSNSEDNKSRNEAVQNTVKYAKKNNAVNEAGTEVFDVERERDKVRREDLSKYDIFRDEDSPIILDVEEERLNSQTEAGFPPVQRSEFEGISSERGLRGVFDTEELVSILKAQSGEDVVVIQMPENLGYADHMIIVSSKSSRHMLAMAGYIRRLFKKKMRKHDKIPIIEGERNKNDDWLALDLGNIVLHLFSKKTRETYDLESLWVLGSEFDPHLNKTEDPLSDILKKHSLYLGDLQPADSKQ